MKLGDIKIEALKLMFTNYDTDMAVEDIPDLLANSEYKDYLFAMPGSINRCLGRFSTNRLNPQKKVNIKTLFTKIEGYYSFEDDAFYSDAEMTTEITGDTNKIYEDDGGELYRFDGDGFEKLNGHLYIDTGDITSFHALNRVSLTKYDGTIDANVEYLWEDDTLIIPYINLFPDTEEEYEGKYVLYYYESMPVITSSTAETTEMDLPEDLLKMIPYYIKGELYQEADAVLANEARSIFEQMLADYPQERTNKQTKVTMKYRMDKL